MSSERRFSVHPFSDSILKEVLFLKNSCVGTQLTEYNRLYKENSAIYHDVCNRFGLSDSTFWILYILRTEEPPITQSDICVALSQPRQTVNSSLKKLEREGLLALSGEGGRHGKPVSLTPQGLELAEKTVDRVIESEQKALLDLSPDEQKQLLDAMRRYNAMLNTRMHDILFAQEDIHE